MWNKNCRRLELAAAIFLILISSNVLGIRINEVSPRTPEFVEIYNPNNEILNLTEWQIKDASNSLDSITCENIPNCSLVINLTYFLILGQNTNISEITAQPITYFYVDDSTIADNLNDGEENITFFNSTFSSSFYYNSSEINKSWQFYNGTLWQSCTPTPGRENNCSIASQNTTNTTPPSNPNNPDPAIEMTYDETMENGEELEVTIDAEDLEDDDYDIKVYITFEENTTIISETYDEEDEDWSSSIYYLEKIISGPGDKTVTIKVRIDEEYEDWHGDATLYVKIRDSDGISVDSIDGNLEVQEREEDDDDPVVITPRVTSTTPASQSNTTTNIIRSGAVKLNSGQLRQESIKIGNGKVLYRSKAEYFKEYGIYGFAFVCLLIIIGLIIKK